MSDRIFSAEERGALDAGPCSTGPRAVDWSGCRLAQAYAPDYVKHSAKQQMRATKTTAVPTPRYGALYAAGS